MAILFVYFRKQLVHVFSHKKNIQFTGRGGSAGQLAQSHPSELNIFVLASRFHTAMKYTDILTNYPTYLSRFFSSNNRAFRRHQGRVNNGHWPVVALDYSHSPFSCRDMNRAIIPENGWCHFADVIHFPRRLFARDANVDIFTTPD